MSESQENQTVDIVEFANMVGFPVDLIKKELFSEDEVGTNEVTMAQLRSAMLSYLNKTMLVEE